jgi:hypothetical protein
MLFFFLLFLLPLPKNHEKKCVANGHLFLHRLDVLKIIIFWAKTNKQQGDNTPTPFFLISIHHFETPGKFTDSYWKNTMNVFQF